MKCHVRRVPAHDYVKFTVEAIESNTEDSCFNMMHAYKRQLSDACITPISKD